MMCLALAGCASAPVQVVPSAPPFAITGRLVASDGERQLSAQVRWSQAGNGRLLLTTPIGQTLALIETDADGARLTTSDGRRYQATDLATLARRGLGWRLPLDELPWWVTGHSAPGPLATSAADGDGFQQSGWNVRFGTRDALGRPLSIDAESPPMRVRLLIDRWLEGP